MTLNSTQDDAIYSALSDDPDLADLVQLFVDDLPLRIDALQALLEACDWPGLEQIAHQLKGTAGSYGFDAVSPLAAELERLAREPSGQEQIGQALQRLVECCARVRAGQP